MSEPFDEVFADLHTGLTPAAVALDPGEVFNQPDQAVSGSRVEPGHHEPRFDGDTSELAPEACWTLQALITAPYVSEADRKYWSCVLQYEDILRSRLAELGVVLKINREHRYAFTEPAVDPSPHSRTILRTRTLSLAASALVLYLYQQYLTAPDDPIVTTQDMIDHMLAYKRPEDTDEGNFHNKIRAAIKALGEAAIIKQVPGTNRYVIYGVITSLLTSDRIEALEQRYRAIAYAEPLQDADGEEAHGA
ncbi:DUF4194 domain-containing protein [Nocardia sp. NPDC004654]|uniref:DUF4194 domain-containing protein n=1 Tax=Nocardia sp. NPDC004654 TaxID=3154776 RepID=UPI0033AF9E8B